MYAHHFGLRCLPFEERWDAQFLLDTEGIMEALAALECTARFSSGAGLLLGEAGTGKTLLLRALLQKIGSSDRCVILSCPANGSLDLSRECCTRFGVSIPAGCESVQRLHRLRRHLLRQQKAGQRALLIIDQAENLSEENLNELGPLIDLDGSEGRLLAVILAGQPALQRLLDRPELARTRQRLYGQRTLIPLTLDQTHQYIRHRLRLAGATRDDIFEIDAIAMIHQCSGGVPRLINHCCHQGMLGAYGARIATISRTFLEESLEPDRECATIVDHKSGNVRPRAPVTEVRKVDASLESAGSGNNLVASQAVSQLGNSTTPHEATLHKGQGDSRSLTTGAARADHREFGNALSLALVERLERASARAEQVCATTEAILMRCEAIGSHVLELVERAECAESAVNSAVRGGTMAVEEIQSRLSRSLAQANHLSNTLESQAGGSAQAVNNTETQLRRLTQACQWAEEMEIRLRSFSEKVADGVDNLQDRAAEFMNGVQDGAAARNQAGQCEQLIARLSAEKSHAGEIADQLSEQCAGGTALREDLNVAIGVARGCDEQLAQGRTAAQPILEQLETGIRTAQAVIEEAALASRAAENAAKQAGERRADLAQAVDQQADQARQLESLVTAGRQLQTNLKTWVSHADEKLSRMDSHLAAGTSVVERLSRASREAHELLHRVEKTHAQFEESSSFARDENARLLAELQSIADHTKRFLLNLDEKSRSAVELQQALSSITDAASMLSDRLDGQVQDAQKLAELLNGRAGQTQELAECFRRAEDAAFTLEKGGRAVQRILDDARALESQLQGLLKRTTEQCSMLQNLQTCSQSLIENHEQAVSESEAAIEHMAAQYEWIEANAQVISELLTQTEDLRGQINTLQQAAAQFQNAAADPRKLIEDAKAQADNLYGVCAAVRKVFAGLSRSALEARQIDEQLQQHRRQAADEVARCTSETVKAAQTMQQWVREAIAAQARLERTLKACPTIGETHPGEVLKQAAKSLELAIPDEAASASPIADAPFDSSNPMAGKSFSSAANRSKTVSRTEQIARLLEEARTADDSN